MRTRWCRMCSGVEVSMPRRYCKDCAQARAFVNYLSKGLSRRERRQLNPDDRSIYAIYAAKAAARRTAPRP